MVLYYPVCELKIVKDFNSLRIALFIQCEPCQSHNGFLFVSCGNRKLVLKPMWKGTGPRIAKAASKRTDAGGFPLARRSRITVINGTEQHKYRPDPLGGDGETRHAHGYDYGVYNRLR